MQRWSEKANTKAGVGPELQFWDCPNQRAPVVCSVNIQSLSHNCVTFGTKGNCHWKIFPFSPLGTEYEPPVQLQRCHQNCNQKGNQKLHFGADAKLKWSTICLHVVHPGVHLYYFWHELTYTSWEHSVCFLGNFNNQNLTSFSSRLTVKPVIGSSANQDVQGIHNEEFSSLDQPVTLPPFNSWGAHYM